MRIVIKFPPQPKGRPRFANGHAYTPKETREYEGLVAMISRKYISAPLRGAVKMEIWFYLPIPTSWVKAKKERARLGLIKPDAKPDIDNLAKAILDSLNGGVGYSDDKQITELILHKEYSEEPRTEIELEELYEADKGNDRDKG